MRVPMFLLTAALVVAIAGFLAIASAGVATASNDGRVPGDDCSNNENAVGQPNPPSGGHSPLEGGSANVINDVADPVQAAASVFNDADTAPGAATGAEGQEQQEATTTGNCLNAGQ